MKYLRKVVRKCWTGGITTAVRTAITNMGVVVGEDDEIVDLAIHGSTV